MSDAGEKRFPFTCPECFVSLKARVSQAGARLMCPSCGATIVVPDAPAPKSIAGTTDRTIDTSAAEAGGEYGLLASGAVPAETSDLIAVKCHVCATRMYTERANLGNQLRCPECETIVPVVEAPKLPGQRHHAQKIDEAGVGQYEVRVSEQPTADEAEVTIPFHCRLCASLMRGSLAQVGEELTCPDCGTRTVVPAPTKVDRKAFIGAAAGTDLSEFAVLESNAVVEGEIPVVCSLCGSRLMARADQVGRKIVCPDCGTETVVPAPKQRPKGAVSGVLARTGRTSRGDHSSQAAPQHAARGSTGEPPSESEKQANVIHIGVNCPRCGTRIHATDRQVGHKVPCPDCDTPILIPPPKAAALVEEQVVRGSEEYTVSSAPETVERTPMSARAIPKRLEDDPDFDFLNEVDDPELRWRLSNTSDELAFLGHRGASGRWFRYCIAGFAVFTILAISLMMFGLPGTWDPTSHAWFTALVSFVIAGVCCVAWAVLFSVNLLAIVQDTSAGQPVVRNWPKGHWSKHVGKAFFMIGSFLISFVPVSILLMTCPPVRPASEYLYTAGFWLTFPAALLSMVDAGSVFVPISGGVLVSVVRRPGAWAWFYLRSFGLIALGLAMYLAFWRHLFGPITLPVLAPMTTSLAMVYARWLGILGVSVREVTDDEPDEAAEEEGQDQRPG